MSKTEQFLTIAIIGLAILTGFGILENQSKIEANSSEISPALVEISEVRRLVEAVQNDQLDLLESQSSFLSQIQVVEEYKEEIIQMRGLLEAAEKNLVLGAHILGDAFADEDFLEDNVDNGLTNIGTNTNVARGRNSVIPNLWLPGSTITISFINGTANQKRKFQKISTEWTRHANIVFSFVSDGGAIRVVFGGSTNSSVVGSRALRFAKHKPTMRLAVIADAKRISRLERTTILHEVGHALGLIHEHQNPNASLVWDRELLISEYLRLVPNWTEEDIDRSIIRKADSIRYKHYRQFDPNSVMNYDFKPSLIISGPRISRGPRLSSSDIEFIERLYP
ncbi:hypothetical protein N9M66_00375 [Litoreibacter sp.]|nr:hypothetical protein [Litoreibacter sp.]